MAYKVGSNTVINDSGKLAGINLISGVNITGTPSDRQALVYDASSGEWVAGAGGKTVMKIFPTALSNTSANPTQFSSNTIDYEVTTDSLLTGVRAENIIFLIKNVTEDGAEVQVANVALANYTSPSVGGDDTINRHYESIDVHPFSNTAGQDVRVRAYAIDGTGNLSNTITVATTTIINPIISTPTNSSPADGDTGASFTQTLTTSAYTTIGHAEPHVSTDWQVSVVSNFANTRINVTANTTALTSFGIPAGVITGAQGDASRTFYWRARYRSATYISDYSSGTSFTTLAAVGSDGQAYSQGTVANNGVSVYYATPGSYTFTIPNTNRIIATVVGAGGGGGGNGQPSHGGGGAGGVRAARDVTAGQSISVTVGNKNGSLSTSGNATGGQSSITYGSETITASGGQATDNPAQQYYAFTAGGTTSVNPNWQIKLNQSGGKGGTGDGDPSYRPNAGGQGYAGGGGGGYNWTGVMTSAPGGQGQGWWGGGGGGNGSQSYPGVAGSPGSGGSGNVVYGSNAQGRGFNGGGGRTFAPGIAGGGPGGGSGGPGSFSDPTPSHSGGGGGGSYGGGGGNTQGWFGAGAQAASGYVRFDWATGE